MFARIKTYMFNKLFRGTKQPDSIVIPGSRRDVLAKQKAAERRCQYLACVAMDSLDVYTRARVLDEYAEVKATLENPSRKSL